jgi:alkylhydroperoxidase family enzyme
MSGISFDAGLLDDLNAAVARFKAAGATEAEIVEGVASALRDHGFSEQEIVALALAARERYRAVGVVAGSERDGDA